MARRKLTGALIGAGFFGGIQAEAWNRIDQADILAVADPDFDRATSFAKQWNIAEVYEGIEKVLQSAKPDFVDIATRPDSHLELVKLAADNGCDCICQKPMAPTVSQCEEMVAYCKSAGVRLLIHENWRWQPWYRAIKRAISECELGPIFHLRFHVRTGDGFGPDAYTVQPYFSEMKRLLIYETLIHHLDTARMIAGEVQSLYCQTRGINPKIVGEDCAVVSLNFRSGATGVIDGNRIHGDDPAPKVFGLLDVECEQGAVRVDRQGKVWTSRYDSGSGETEFDYKCSDQGYRGDSVFAVQQHMVQCLATGKPCESEGESYLKSVSLVEACYESADKNSVVELEI